MQSVGYRPHSGDHRCHLATRGHCDVRVCSDGFHLESQSHFQEAGQFWHSFCALTLTPVLMQSFRMLPC